MFIGPTKSNYMNRKRCDRCNGVGSEYCEVHGSHPCSNCHGRGCVEGGGFIVGKIWQQDNHFHNMR